MYNANCQPFLFCFFFHYSLFYQGKLGKKCINQEEKKMDKENSRLFFFILRFLFYNFFFFFFAQKKYSHQPSINQPRRPSVRPLPGKRAPLSQNVSESLAHVFFPSCVGAAIVGLIPPSISVPHPLLGLRGGLPLLVLVLVRLLLRLLLLLLLLWCSISISNSQGMRWRIH